MCTDSKIRKQIVNATQEINGKLYERVPAPASKGCEGCAFRATSTTPCGLLGRDISCTEPRWVVFVEVGAKVKPEPDEQCGVGNG